MQRGEMGREKEVPVPGHGGTDPNCAQVVALHRQSFSQLSTPEWGRESYGGAVSYGEVGVIILRGFEQGCWASAWL